MFARMETTDKQLTEIIYLEEGKNNLEMYIEGTASQSIMYSGTKGFPCFERDPDMALQMWKQAPQVSGVFVSGSIRIYADRIDPDQPRRIG